MEEIKQGYKQTDIGVIPEDWEVKSILNIAPLQRGFDLPISNISIGIYPVVFSNGILKYHNSYKAKGPGVITGRSGTIGKLFYVSEDYWPHNTTLWITNFKGNYPKYIFYLFNSLNFSIFASGSGVPTLNRNDIHDIKIAIPNSKLEQTAIATALSDTDALIAALDKKIAKKQQIKQGAMQQLLTGKKRLPGFSGEWVEKPLGDTLTIKHGRDQKQIECSSGKYPILGTGGVMGYTNTPIYSKESVLIGRKGTIDKPYYYDTPFWTVDTLFYSEINSGYVAKFLFYNFNLIDWYLYNEASGVPSLNAKVIEAIKINIPNSKLEQTAIAQILTDMDNEIARLEKGAG